VTTAGAASVPEQRKPMTTQFENTTRQIQAAFPPGQAVTKWDYYSVIDAVSSALEQLSPADDPMPGLLAQRDEVAAWRDRHPYSHGIMCSVVSSLQQLLRMKVPDRAFDPEVTHPSMHTLLRAAVNAQVAAARLAIETQEN
jgi:hypothetical protein